ncbi:flagellar protein MotY [Idiomarina sp. HP20-50]|uniref:flagellar protein MotY n=1 Tax=Idiomarina sp. HP20-50 TaxID=3070813 RepID=UPI00294ACC77|nr:OmpA family protein [Idiomarina sp. HP20-50]MDV6317200.1 OmpA family protein [Idiomarina sp. HP20-50]
MKNRPVLTAASVALLLFTAQGQANSVRHYSANLDNSAWQMSEENRLTCEMEHKIPRYGKVFFQSEASKELNLRMKMEMRQLPDGYGVSAIESVPPRWQPGESSYRIGSMKLYKQFDGELRKQLAWTLLKELEKGRYPTFFYSDWYNNRDQVAVSLSSVNFRNAYDEFMTCVNALLPFSFDDIAYTVLNHEAESEKLTLTSQRKLKQISDYLQVDSNLELVLVDAYTDSLGAREPNQALTEQRAQEIEQFFIERGIDKTRIKTVGHGEDRPIKSNDNELNRQINRRVIVQLTKPSPIEL